MTFYNIDKVPTEIQQELASKFREIRKNKKISQTQLANKSGVSLGSIKRFEQTGQISLESLLKLAHLFDRLNDFDSVFKPQENLKEIEKLFNK
ncbi:helix-turn-helix domain-containing protein [Flavobacterium sp.]|uniref:helix-turn-helix domain-containing protein n=1 Tax=Flavobacterium sp. TaxID=239 RepID=UPI003750CCF0